MKKNRLKRGDIQFAVFVIVVLITINHSLVEVGKGISWLTSGYIHYVCPVCGVTTIYQLFASNADFVTKILNPVSWVIAASVLTAIFFGPIFCGWICPFGGYQDFIADKIGRKIFKKRYNTFINKKLDSALRWLRYVSLGVVVYMTAKSAVTVLESINPYHALLDLFVGEFAAIGLIFLGVITIASLFIHRPWCKYLCPYGAFLGIFNIFRVKAVIRDENTCINCKKCSKACPMNIEVAETNVVRDHQCISCLECTSNNACPVENTVEMKRPKGIKEVVKVNAKSIVAFVLAIAALAAFTVSVVSNEAGDGTSEYDIENLNIELDGIYESGTYTGVGTGFNSGLTAQVTIEDNQITDIDIVSHNETMGYYETAFEEVPSSIVSSQSTDVDTVSGATRSSEGIIEAVEDALAQALISDSLSSDVSSDSIPDDNGNGMGQETDDDRQMQQNQEQNRNQGDASDENDEAKVEIIAGDYADGVYIGSGTGYGGEMTVEVTVEKGSIISVEIIEDNETANFLQRAVEIIEDIITTQSTDVDTVTNATESSDAIIEAVNDALNDAK